ncbi:DUF4861 family protein [Planctomycetota bacterium]
MDLRKHLHKELALFFCILFFISSTCSAINYYIDQDNGNDGNKGFSKVNAWQSLHQVNATEFKAGDSILFKRGGQWTGRLRPQGSGVKNNRIVIGAYGQGLAPIFDAQGKKDIADLMSATIGLYNQEYWEIRDIEVRNYGQGNPDKPVEKAGILVLAKDIGTLHDFKLENLTLSRVNGSLETRTNGGLFFNVIADDIPEKRVPTRFDGIHVNNCRFLDVDRGGFLNQSFWRNRDLHSKFGESFLDSKQNTWYPSLNILIENCRFENIGGNGLVTRVAESPVVQNNLFVRCSLKTTGNASYPYNCNNALWQFNEACYTVYNEGDVDASGFDSDYQCKNTILQYNYSHHNDWGGLLVCSWGKIKGSFNDGTIVRNNIFQDEKHHLIRFSGNITNTTIRDNLFITDDQIDDVALWYKEWGSKWPDNTVLSENTFYNQGRHAFLRLGNTTRNTISNNHLAGDAFDEKSQFNSVPNSAELTMKVAAIRKIGARKKQTVSEAKRVTDIMWSDWYTQGTFSPTSRIAFTLTNTLDSARENCPVVIKRDGFPMPDLHEMWVTVVDPELPSFAGPSEELLRLQGGHQIRAETNGHALFHQMDDLDKDGLWDELFFQVDIEAKTSKTIYIYLGENIRGWNKHFTHANIGSYCRHQMPFWESENVGWKIWFANCCDVYAKRKPVLMSNYLYMDNLDGYGVSVLDKDWGTDIQSVARSLGGGGICLFEDPNQPDIVSMPRFTPVQKSLVPKSMWNAGQLSDTRYAYEVVVNGPVRSMIKIKGMNWDSGNGFYEYEQTYTVFAKQSYCHSEVTYTTFKPKHTGVKMGCGFRKKPEENHFLQREGIIISSGPEAIRDPENIDDRKETVVDFIGTALIVKQVYQPEYQFISELKGNHTFRIKHPVNNTYEYLLASAWSEGAVYNNKEDFTSYIQKTALEYNHPLQTKFIRIQTK